MRAAAIILIAAVLVAGLAGCASGSAIVPTTPPVAFAAAAQTREDRFVAHVLDTLTTTISRTDLIEVGTLVCSNVGGYGITRADLERELGQEYGSQPAVVLVGAAQAYLCPGKVYRPAGATPAATPTGPASSIPDGTHEVGVDVVAGRYKTTGGPDCYWARLHANDGSSRDIIDNGLGAGPQTVTIKAGEYFETQRCAIWSRS